MRTLLVVSAADAPSERVAVNAARSKCFSFIYLNLSYYTTSGIETLNALKHEKTLLFRVTLHKYNHLYKGTYRNSLNLRLVYI